MREVLRHDKSCRVCGSEAIMTVFQLVPTPPGDCFVGPDQKDIPQATYVLDLAICDDCGYVHLPFVLDPVVSYVDYVYVSKVTPNLSSHYDSYAEDLVETYSVPIESLIVDIGSNDGTMLEAFQRRGMRVLGVEPAIAIAQAANIAGVRTLNSFFDADLAESILSDQGPVAVVTANYMYANVDDILDFTRSVVSVLAPDGLFVVQTGYHPEQMKRVLVP